MDTCQSEKRNFPNDRVSFTLFYYPLQSTVLNLMLYLSLISDKEDELKSYRRKDYSSDDEEMQPLTFSTDGTHKRH